MVPQIFGIQNVGTILGYLSLFWAIGGVSGPILAGYVFDITKSHNIAFLSGGFLVAIGIASLYFTAILINPDFFFLKNSKVTPKGVWRLPLLNSFPWPFSKR